jgi:hypothetical protein
MKSSITKSTATKTALITLLLACFHDVSHGLIVQQQQQQHHRGGISSQGFVKTVCTTCSTALGSASSSEQNNNGDDNPLYSFGAEVVPQGQRPVNEYLDMKEAPLFGWGSNEVGLKGLLIRLGILYSVVFAIM